MLDNLCNFWLNTRFKNNSQILAIDESFKRNESERKWISRRIFSQKTDWSSLVLVFFSLSPSSSCSCHVSLEGQPQVMYKIRYGLIKEKLNKLSWMVQEEPQGCCTTTADSIKGREKLTTSAHVFHAGAWIAMKYTDIWNIRQERGMYVVKAVSLLLVVLSAGSVTGDDDEADAGFAPTLNPCWIHVSITMFEAKGKALRGKRNGLLLNSCFFEGNPVRVGNCLPRSLKTGNVSFLFFAVCFFPFLCRLFLHFSHSLLLPAFFLLAAFSCLLPVHFHFFPSCPPEPRPGSKSSEIHLNWQEEEKRLVLRIFDSCVVIRVLSSFSSFPPPPSLDLRLLL